MIGQNIADIMFGEQYLNLIKKIYIFILAQIFMLLHIRLIKKELVLLQLLKVKIRNRIRQEGTLEDLLTEVPHSISNRYQSIKNDGVYKWEYTFDQMQ